MGPFQIGHFFFQHSMFGGYTCFQRGENVQNYLSVYQPPCTDLLVDVANLSAGHHEYIICGEISKSPKLINTSSSRNNIFLQDTVYKKPSNVVGKLSESFKVWVQFPLWYTLPAPSKKT